MGDRTIELTVTNGWDDAEEARAGRVFVLGKIVNDEAFEMVGSDTDLAHFMFDAHDEVGNEYVVVIQNHASEVVWATLWTDGYVNLTIDRGFAMRAIPYLPPDHFRPRIS